MTPPAGTYLAKVRGGLIQFPAPIQGWCEAAGWTLFRVEAVAENRLDIRPVLAEDGSDLPDEFLSSLSGDGKLWIPAMLRGLVGLGEQSVMMRFQDGGIEIFLRKVFQTLGFGP
ncbi:MAG: hypothetical protein ABUS51_07430 [Acidobacteriota bacterium]